MLFNDNGLIVAHFNIATENDFFIDFSKEILML